ncbi:RNA polymerase III subunit C82 [Coemansia sp. RSA 2336]|nr:RNA polymerase III subunit C82 [Coemansia sp. RSA 2336]
MFTQLESVCRRLVREHYGPIVEGVAGVLIEKGRLPLGQVVARTELPALSVRQALAVLIQHSHVTHAQTKEGSRMVTFYSINLRNILRLQRSGLYMALVEERMGKYGLAVFQTIMLNGCMNISSVREALNYSKLNSTEKQKLAVAVAKLVRERFITAIQPIDAVTKIDRLIQAEAHEIDKLKSVPTPKDLLNIRRKIEEQDESEYTSTEVVGMKRQATGSEYGGPPKVLIGPDGQPIVLGGSFGNGIDSSEQAPQKDEDLVDDKQCFRIYYDRLDVFLRNKQLVNYFSAKYSEEAGIVLKTILRLTEPHTKTCKDKISEPVAAQQIIQNLPPDTHLDHAVDMSSDRFFREAPGATDDSSAGRRATLGKMAFALLDVLRRDSSEVVVKVDERGSGQFRINFERAATILRDECLDLLVLNKFGSTYSRIVRALRDKQKLDEKMVSQFAMMPMAKCRERLHEMALAGFVDTVEIPRTADRNPSRMAYLWYVNPSKQVSAALRSCLQGTCNIMQRREKQLAARASLVAKSQRQDIVAGTSQLSLSEQNALNSLLKHKQQMDAAIVRLDSMLLLLHDIVPGSTAL